MKKDANSLAHTTWRGKYHIVFAPKYRSQAIYGKYKQSIGEIIHALCERKGVESIEANACRDHVHMLVSIPPKLSMSQFNRLFKRKK
jgi:putative transposase